MGNPQFGQTFRPAVAIATKAENAKFYTLALDIQLHDLKVTPPVYKEFDTLFV